MTLIVHHMQVSQSERVIWLCEELEIPYEIVIHKRNPIFAPQSIKDLNPIGQAPVIQDGEMILAESGACIDYIINVYGKGRLTIPPGQPQYADYLYWHHFPNGSLQPHMLAMLLLISFREADEMREGQRERLHRMLNLANARLEKCQYLAGDTFTSADIMIVFSLTTMRVFLQINLTKYPAILSYLRQMTSREAYKRAREKGDPDLELAIQGNPPRSFFDGLK